FSARWRGRPIRPRRALRAASAGEKRYREDQSEFRESASHGGETARPDAAFPRRPNLRLHHRICPGGKVTERWSAARLRAVKQDAPIIGIDLGTTNSSAAYVDETGMVRLIPYQAGTFIIPSIFAIDD